MNISNTIIDRALHPDVFSLLVKIYMKKSDPINEELLQVIKDDVKGGKSEKGNINFQLFHSKDNPNNYFLYEIWENRDKLLQHFEEPWSKKAIALGERSKGKEIISLKDLLPIAEKDRRDFITNLNSINLTVEFSVKKGMEDKFLSPFLKSIALTRKNEKGNIAFHLYKLLEKPNKYLLMERWESQKALEEHHTKEYTKRLFGVFKETLEEDTFDGNTFLTGVSNIKELPVE